MILNQIVDLNGNEIGEISKKWTGFVQEAFTDTDVFGISFPMDLDVRMKAILVGACMLIVSGRDLDRMLKHTIYIQLTLFRI